MLQLTEGIWVYGSYPELIHLKGIDEKQDYLREIVNSYLLKDILEFEGVRNSEKMYALLRLIAFQTGNLVSLEEIGKQLSMSRNTVERYLDLLSKVFAAHEIKWNHEKRPNPPKIWTNAYPDSTFTIINPDNYLEWILE